MPFKDRKKFYEWAKKKRLERKKKIIEIKRKSGCERCGWNKHPEILQFHHKGKKDFGFAKIDLSSYSWERLLKEMKKCNLWCPNCHMWYHYEKTKG